VNLLKSFRVNGVAPHLRQYAAYTGVEKREEHESREVIWQIAARRSTYSKLNKRSLLYKAKRKIEYCKAQTRAKVEHPFRVIKRQFGYVKVRFRGLMVTVRPTHLPDTDAKGDGVHLIRWTPFLAF